jgi:hypothetical protein
MITSETTVWFSLGTYIFSEDVGNMEVHIVPLFNWHFFMMVTR